MVSDSKSDVRKHRGFKSLPLRQFFVSVQLERGREHGRDRGPLWRGDRVAEGARLEIVCTERYRGFESLSLRQPTTCVSVMVPGDANAVNPARPGREQR